MPASVTTPPPAGPQFPPVSWCARTVTLRGPLVATARSPGSPEADRSQEARVPVTAGDHAALSGPRNQLPCRHRLRDTVTLHSEAVTPPVSLREGPCLSRVTRRAMSAATRHSVLQGHLGAATWPVPPPRAPRASSSPHRQEGQPPGGAGTWRTSSSLRRPLSVRLTVPRGALANPLCHTDRTEGERRC